MIDEKPKSKLKNEWAGENALMYGIGFSEEDLADNQDGREEEETGGSEPVSAKLSYQSHLELPP